MELAKSWQSDEAAAAVMQLVTLDGSQHHLHNKLRSAPGRQVLSLSENE
jgi:hypothetical protein